MKRTASLLLMLILIAGVFSFAPAARADDAYSEFDFMIVIDRSGSMLRTDPDYVVTEAAKMFIDACEPSGSRVSVMTFNTKADHSGFIALDSVANKRHVKRIIDNIKYPKSAGSDMGEALLAASEYLQQNGNPARQKFIILMTDGTIQSTGYGRTEDESRADVERAIEICAGDGTPVYTIGAVNSGWRSGTDDDMLMNIADSTGGMFLLAEDINRVPDFFQKIFASLRDIHVVSGDDWVSDGDYHCVDIEVFDKFLLYADVNISCGKPLQDVYLLDPSGTRVPFDDQNFIYEQERLYSYVRLVRPSKGTWKLYVLGATRDSIHVDYIMNYSVSAETAVDPDTSYIGSPVKLMGRLLMMDSAEADADLYGLLTSAYAVVERNGAETTVPLTYDAALNCMAADFVPEEKGDYQVSVYMECLYFTRTGEPVSFTVGNAAPVATEATVDGGELAMRKTSTVDVSDYFYDPDGDPLTYTAALDSGSRGDLDTVLLPGGFLNLTAKGKGAATVIVTAQDPEGASASMEVTVSVIDPGAPIRYIAYGLIAAVIAAVLALSRRVKGAVSVVIPQVSEEAAEISLRSCRKRSLLLSDLLRVYDRKLRDSFARMDEDALGQLAKHADVKRIKLTGTVGKAKRITMHFKGTKETAISGAMIKSGTRTLTNGTNIDLLIGEWTVRLTYSDGKRKASYAPPSEF